MAKPSKEPKKPEPKKCPPHNWHTLYDDGFHHADKCADCGVVHGYPSK